MFPARPSIAVLLICLVHLPAFAQTPAVSRLVTNSADRIVHEIELRETEKQLQQGAEARRQFEADLSKIKSDRAQLMQKTIDLAASVKALEAKISATEERLSKAMDEDQRIARDLEQRRAVILDLLSGLQRIGQMPPPIVLSDPEDLLSTIRGAMLLGAALPELSDESRRLSADLQAREIARKTIEDERKLIEADMINLVAERQRLTLALEARQRDETQMADKLVDEAARVAALAAKSQTLKDLLGHAEQEIGAVIQATDAANAATSQAEEDAKASDAQGRRDERAKSIQEAFNDPSRIAPKVAFSELKGVLKQIVAGAMVRGFNDKDQAGNLTKGVTVTTRPGAIISAPSDVWVSYAGPFRSFGQLLILNAGGGYYILLAGMDRMMVGLGQFVLAGEPVAVMPGPSATASDHAATTLYIEFRKDGTPFDPLPWLSPGTFEKVR